MIKVNKNFKYIPPSLKDEKIEMEIEKILLEPEYSKKRYDFEDDVKKGLKKIYNGKCAYCESKGAEIDHYRPKGEVFEEKDHNGYYWLKYEWSNLLYVCKDCNRKKHTKFPLGDDGKRVFLPQSDYKEWFVKSKTFEAENPLLLNPEIDKPEEHLIFLYNGDIKEKDGSIRGKKTIDICGLDRISLIREERKKQIDKIFRWIKMQVVEFYSLKEKTNLDEINLYGLTFKTVFNEIKIRQGPQFRYSRVFFFMYENFEDFFENNCEIKELSYIQKKIVKEAFNLFREEQL